MGLALSLTRWSHDPSRGLSSNSTSSRSAPPCVRDLTIIGFIESCTRPCIPNDPIRARTLQCYKQTCTWEKQQRSCAIVSTGYSHVYEAVLYFLPVKFCAQVHQHTSTSFVFKWRITQSIQFSWWCKYCTNVIFSQMSIKLKNYIILPIILTT